MAAINTDGQKGQFVYILKDNAVTMVTTEACEEEIWIKATEAMNAQSPQSYMHWVFPDHLNVFDILCNSYDCDLMVILTAPIIPLKCVLNVSKYHWL